MADHNLSRYRVMASYILRGNGQFSQTWFTVFLMYLQVKSMWILSTMVANQVLLIVFFIICIISLG